MLENIIGKRYSEALAKTFTDDAMLAPALDHLNTLSQAFITNKQLAVFFANPSIPIENKKSMVESLCGRIKVGKEIRNLLLMLTERKKIQFLQNITEYFEKVSDERLSQARAKVISAYPLSKKNIEKLKTSLNNITGKNVLIDAEVDESLIGGVVLRMDSLVVDATIRNRLKLLKRSIEKEEVA
ncbi:MAG: ATP synthase F1 subunit delta [Nitrospinales bacterium]